MEYFVYLFALRFGKEKQKKLTTETIAICIFRLFKLHTKFMSFPKGSCRVKRKAKKKVQNKESEKKLKMKAMTYFNKVIYYNGK